MIDTDRYEGHTPAPWDKLSEYCPVGSIDKQLIADAPLLLEEVKRLRKALYEVTKTEFFSYLKDVRPNDFLTEILEEMIK